MVKEITSKLEFNATINDTRLVVVDFTASWCGPCKRIAPFFASLSSKYPDVVFCKVDGDANQDIVMELRVSAFPTFKFFIKGTEVSELRGGDPQQLEAKVVQLKASAGGSSFTGKSAVLGSAGDAPAWDGVGSPPTADQARAAREARLRVLDESLAKQAKFIPAASAPKESAGGSSTNAAAAAAAGSSSTMNVDGGDDAAATDEALMAQALAMSMAAAAAATVAAGGAAAAADGGGAAAPMVDDEDEDMIPVPVDEGILAELAGMGFSDIISRKGIVHGKSLEGALEWISAHQDDADVETTPYLVRREDADAERAKANKPPLTEEEKAAKLAELKAKVERRRREKAEADKKLALAKEKERRESGQKALEVAEERQRLLRRREIERAKKEKDDEAKERARLKAEIARDKELRRRHGGVLPSVLGVDGYNPSIVSAASGSGDGAANGAAASATPPPPPAPTTTTVASSSLTAETITVREDSEGITADRLAKIDALITTIARHRVGSDGGNALKLLNTFVSNVLKSPQEPKFRSINAESNAFKTKIVPLAGTVALLKSVGFLKSTTEEKYIMVDAHTCLLKIVSVKLQEALQMYIQVNGPL